MESDISLYRPSGATASAASVPAEQPSGADEFAEAVLTGLTRKPRSIPCRFFYDARGSELFEEITKLDEYYPTRIEIVLLETYGKEIAAVAGSGRALIEF